MRRAGTFLLGVLVGLVLCYVTMDWRIGAAESARDLYLVGAMNAFQQLDQCTGQQGAQWPRKRGLNP